MSRDSEGKARWWLVTRNYDDDDDNNSDDIEIFNACLSRPSLSQGGSS